MIRFPVPAEVFLDSSVVIAALYPGTTNSKAAIEYCNELRNNSSVVFLSDVLRIEVGRGMRRLATIPGDLPQATRTAVSIWTVGERNPLIRQRWFSHGVRRFNAFLAQFTSYIEIPLSTSIWLDSINLMATESLDASDAIHLATARAHGIADFCTADSDFRRITWPQVHLVRD